MGGLSGWSLWGRLLERKELQLHTESEIYKWVPLETSVEYWSVHTCEEATGSQGKNQLKEKPNSSEAHTGLRRVL